MTSVTEVRSASARLFAGIWHPLVNVIATHTIMLQLVSIIECDIAHFLCTMRVFEVWASSSFPRLPLCQIYFCTASIAEIDHGEKLHTQSLNYSLTHPADLMPREPKRLCFGIRGIHNNSHNSNTPINGTQPKNFEFRNIQLDSVVFIKLLLLPLKWRPYDTTKMWILLLL